MLPLPYSTPRSQNKASTGTHILATYIYLPSLPFIYWYMTPVLMQSEMSTCRPPFKKALILPEVKPLWSSAVFCNYFYILVVLERTALCLKSSTFLFQSCRLHRNFIAAPTEQILTNTSSRMERHSGSICQELFHFPGPPKASGVNKGAVTANCF